MMKSRSLLVLLVLLTASCTVSKRPDTSKLPCHDGWIIDSSGSSIVWQPTHKFWDELVALLPKNRTVDCWHKMSDGRYLIPNVDTDGVAYASTFQIIEGKYQLIFEELISRAD